MISRYQITKCMFFIPCPGIVSEKGVREEVPPVLQQQILQLALDLPASKFSWFRIQVKESHFINLHFE